MSRDNFRVEALQAWGETLREIFPDGIPASAKWTNNKAIASVLERVGGRPNSNQAFFPSIGTSDVEGAEILEVEPNYVSLRMSGRLFDVVNPSLLSFESFGPELEWAYFRLECEPFPQTDTYEEPQGRTEEVGCLPSGEYITRSDWDEGVHNGRRVPDDAILLVRRIAGGPIVIFSKGSLYNLGKPDMSLGQHAEVSAEKFRDYIRRNAEAE